MKSMRRIGFLLTVVFLIPALFFSVYELSSLDKDEKMIQDIYNKQLEAILFSVNQYSDDIILNWVSRIESNLDQPVQEDSIPSKIRELLMLHSSLKGVFVSGTVNGRPALRSFSIEYPASDALWNNAMTTLQSDSAAVNQLLKYKKSGFQKVQRLNFPPADNFHCLAFIIETRPGEFKVAGLLVDGPLFIEDIVGPRLQTIAGDQFILSAIRRSSDSVLYTTAARADAEEEATAAATKELWIFPEYVLGIRTRGDTLQQLISERTRTNLLLLVALDLIMIAAVVLVFRNLKREVDLAENKATFVSNVSHELRTPLALISMFAETLEMNRVSSEEKRQEYYKILSKESQRLTGIVNRILNFSRAEAKKKVLYPEKLNLTSEVRSVLDTYDFHLRNKGFDYSLSGPDDISVTADREALVEAVINIIDNAVKYSDEARRIEITTGTDGEKGYIAIKDFGVGISKHDQKHIFDKFYRVPTGNLARSRGTGLGLSLVKQLMDEQRGSISVASEPGKGSVFKLSFPTA